jgi:hypothetical protein
MDAAVFASLTTADRGVSTDCKRERLPQGDAKSHELLAPST